MYSLSEQSAAMATMATTSQPKSRPRSCAIPSIIGADIVIKGTIRATGDIQLDGRVDGEICGANVAIGSSGQIHGKIVANDLIIRGHFKGGIRARRVLLCSTCHVEGDILHEGLVLEAGAFFDGNCIPPDDLLADAAENESESNRATIRANPQSSAPKARQNKESVLSRLSPPSLHARELFFPLRSRALSKYLFLLLLMAGAVFAIANDKLRLSVGGETALDSSTSIIAAYDFLSAAPSDFERKVQTNFRQLGGHASSLMSATSRLFEVSANWMYAQMPRKAGGRTMLAENHPIVSNIGAIGVIQHPPASHEKLPEPGGPDADLSDTHDHAITATTDLSGSHNLDHPIQKSPTFLEKPRTDGISTASLLDAGAPHTARSSALLAEFTRPDGSPVWINVSMVKSIRATFPGEYPSSVQSVVSWGTSKQGVRESVAQATALIKDHGGKP